MGGSRSPRARRTGANDHTRRARCRELGPPPGAGAGRGSRVAAARRVARLPRSPYSGRMTFAPIPEILDELKAGRPIILVDDPDRENEGDLCFAAEFVTPELINFMATDARGLICLALDGAICDQLELPHAGRRRTGRASAPRSPSASRPREGVTTGISRRRSRAHDPDRRRPDARPGDLVPPGPRRSRCARATAACWCAPARPRASSTCAAWPACGPAGVICEIMNDDGDDGARARARAVRAAARPQDVQRSPT